MKKLLVIAIALTSVNAFATRARMTSLGNSVHLVDTMSVFNRPTDLFSLGDVVNIETGLKTTTTTDNEGANAEGLLIRSMGDAKLALALGHQSPNASVWASGGGLRSAAALAGAGYVNLRTNQQNPLSIMYAKKNGDISWAGTFGFSSYNNKAATTTTLQKEDSMGFNVGAASGPWDITLSSGMANNVALADGSKLTGTMALTLSGGYKVDTMYWYGYYSAAGIKVESSAGAEALKYDTTTIKAGVVNSHKKDGSELFYSVAVNQTETKNGTASTKDTSMTLPVTIGFETDATSWLALRASVTQSSIINKSKTEISTTTELDPGANSTTVAAGAGLKFNKVTLDGTLSKLTGATATQVLNGNDLFAQVGMTYMF